MKSFNGKMNTNFHNNEIPKEGSHCICLSVILTNSVFRTGNSFYPKVFLEKCKHVVKEKETPEYITDNIEIFSDDSEREDSNEGNSDEKILMKEIKCRMCLVFIFKAFRVILGYS